MKKQFILAVSALSLVVVIFIFGRTTAPKYNTANVASPTKTTNFNINLFIDSVRKKLSPAELLVVSELENGVKRGDVHTQKIESYENLAAFWKDSVRMFEPYAFYISEAAKLDNSEKKLTFAAQLFLEGVRGEHDEAKLNWETEEAILLFEKAIQLNPDNADLRIGLGSCYVFGKGRSGDPQSTMKGIQELLGVVKKDSNNMKAQLVLGVGGYVSGQYDKAIDRLTKVVTSQPGNLEAIAFLADTYAAAGKKEEAIKWYTLSKRIANNPRYSKEVDERIKMLK